MLVNLLPAFLDVIAAEDRRAAWRHYFDSHRLVLTAYWRNYVLDPESGHAEPVIRRTLDADRADLLALLERTDVPALVEDAVAKSTAILKVDRPTDTWLMVGVGAANAGELVVQGRGVAFICLEHFTGRANPDTWGMGLPADQIPLWVAHEIAHTVRYTSPDSESELKRLVAESGGYYDYWQTGSRASLLELLINEGLAVHAAEAVVPGFDAADYFGYPKRQYHRLRQLEAFLRRAAEHDYDRRGLGLRLRYLSGGMSPAARLVQGRVLPERAGYYLGYRLAEALVAELGIAAALRAPAAAFLEADRAARGIATA